MSIKITLYHVTPRINQASIMHSGLDPERATGKRLVVWLCQEDRLTWALAHISDHHHKPVDDLIICTCKALDVDHLGRTAWKGVYTHSQILRPDAYSASAMALRLEESKMQINARIDRLFD